MKSTIRMVSTSKLKPHRLQGEAFPDRKPNEEFIEDVRENGVRQIVTVAKDLTILSGHCRVLAAVAVGITELEVAMLDLDPESLEARREWARTNSQRIDMNTKEKGRFYLIEKGLEEECAKLRKWAGKALPSSSKVDHAPNLAHGASSTEKEGKTRAPVAAAIAASKVGWTRATAEKAAEAVQALDKAIAAGDQEAAAKIEKALEKGPTKAAAVARDTGFSPKLDSEPKKEVTISEKQAKALKALTSAMKTCKAVLNQDKMEKQIGDAIHAGGHYLTGGGSEVEQEQKPATTEDFVQWVLDGLADLRTKDNPKARLEAIRALSIELDVSKLIPAMLDGSDLKPAVYLGELPSEHIPAAQKVQQEIQHRLKQMKAFENWDQNGRPKSSRDLCKAVRNAVKSFENHCAVGDEEQPALIEVMFPEKLDTPEFKEIWNEWWSLRKKTKKTVTESVRKKQLKVLEKGDPDQAIDMVTTAIEKGWKGIDDKAWEYGPYAGRMLGQKPSENASSPESDGELFLRVIDAVRKAWAPELRNESDVEKALNDKHLFEAAKRVGLNTIQQADHRDLTRRAQFIRKLKEVRGAV